MLTIDVIYEDATTDTLTGRTVESAARTRFGKHTTVSEVGANEWEVVERTASGAWKSVHYFFPRD